MCCRYGKLSPNYHQIPTSSESQHDKPTKWPLRPVITQISLGIRPVWSVFAVRMKKHWVLSYPLSIQWTLIRLGGCPGWFESSLGAHVSLLVLSCCGSSIWYSQCFLAQKLWYRPHLWHTVCFCNHTGRKMTAVLHLHLSNYKNDILP